MHERSVCWRLGAPRMLGVSSRYRSDSRCAICWGDSARSRTAASSMASGRPSSRSQISTTASWLPPSTSNPDSTAAARSANRLTASYSDNSVQEWHSCRIGDGERGHELGRLAAHAQRLAAGRQHAHVGRGQQDGLGQLRAGRRPGARSCPAPAAAAAGPGTRSATSSVGWPGCSPSPRVAAMVCATRAGSCSWSSSTSHTPSSKARWTSAAGPQGQPGLAHPAHADQGEQAGGSQRPLRLGHLATAADEAAQLQRQVSRPAPRGNCHGTP